VILDLTMPRMDGAATLQRLRRERPELPIVLSSGYTAATAERRFAVDHGCHFLQKPYSRDALLDQVKQILRAGADTAREPACD